MKLKKSFVTIFTDAQNFHLVKDVGQLPYFMYKTGQYAAELVSYKNDKSYPYLNYEVKGLKLSFIQNLGRFFYFEKGIIKYLFSSSKKIDVLNLFHFKKDNIAYLLLYKALNPKGVAYVKLDMDILFFKDYNSFFYSKYALKNLLLRILIKLHFRLTDLFSVETKDAHDYLLQVYPELKDKLICIPNGVDDQYIDRHISVKSFQEKENIILAVGRIGTFQKNTELFLEVLLKVDLNDWKVFILGPIEENFTAYISNFFTARPHLRDKIIFAGNITDRQELFGWYNRAKILCMTSRFEGFPITFPEALYFGNYIITTSVSSAHSITFDSHYGTITGHDASDFARAINQATESGFLNENRYHEIRRFSKEHFTWPVIIDNLLEKLKSL